MEQSNETTNLLSDTEDLTVNQIEVNEVTDDQTNYFTLPTQNIQEEFNNEHIEKPKETIAIHTTFKPIRIGKLVDAQIVNKVYYDEDQSTIKYPSSISFLSKKLEVEKKGLLKSADLKLTFSIPKNFDIKQNENISYRLSEQTLPFNLRTKVDLVYNEVKSIESANILSPVSDELFSIVLPIYKGIDSISLPLLDDIHTKGELLLHHTVVIDSINESQLFESNFIRLVVFNNYKDIKIVSNTTNNIDVIRISEMLQNSKEFLVKSAVSLKDSIAGKLRKNKKEVSAEAPVNNLYPQITSADHDIEFPTVNSSVAPNQFQKVDINSFATPISLPPNCQIIYCVAPNPSSVPSF